MKTISISELKSHLIGEIKALSNDDNQLNICAAACGLSVPLYR